MKLIAPTSKSEVHFGEDTLDTLLRAAIFLLACTGEPWLLRLDDPVETCTFHPGAGLNFGDLEESGIAERDLMHGPSYAYDRDDITIVWKILLNVEFTDTEGNEWKQGDMILWDK